MGREDRSRYRIAWICLASLCLFVAWCADAEAQDDATLPFAEAQRLVNEEYIPAARTAFLRQGNTALVTLWEQGAAGQPFLQYELIRSDQGMDLVSPRYIHVPVESDSGLIGLVGIDPYTGQFRWRMGHLSPEAMLPVPPGPEQLPILITGAGYTSKDYDLHDIKLLYAGFRNYWYVPSGTGNTAEGLVVPVGEEEIRQLANLGLEEDHTGFLVNTHPLPSTPVAELEQLPLGIDSHHTGLSLSGDGSAATWMVGAIPYYTQDCNLWCWAASLSMLHQWWSPLRLGRSYAQQSEIARYAKGSVACAGGSADDIYRTVRNWQGVDSLYESFQTSFKGEGIAFEPGDPSGYNNDPKTWIAYLEAPVIAFVDTSGNGKANHAVLLVGYDDLDGGGVVYLHDPWYYNWWPGHGGEPCYDVAVSYSHFDTKWNVTWEGLLFTAPSGLDTSKRRGMVSGVPGDNSFARIGVTSAQISGPIDDGSTETVFNLGVEALGDNTAALYDSFGHFQGSGISAELLDPGQGNIVAPVYLGDFLTYNPPLPSHTINLVTDSIQEDESHGAGSFDIDPGAVGLIGLEATWWLRDEDDRWHSDAVISVLDDRGGSNTSFDMVLPALVEDTQGPSVYQFDVEDDDVAGPAVLDYSDSGDAAPGIYSFRVRLRDPSGVLDDSEFPRIYFRWDSDEVDETHNDGYLNADWESPWYTARLAVDQDRLGHALFWRCLAYDDDDDREEDNTQAWSPVYGGGTIIEGSLDEAPSDVVASDGTLPDRVSLVWQPVPGADQYGVFRTTSQEGPKEPLGTAGSPPYEDTTATIGVHYFYSVKACNNAGCSGFSMQDVGFVQGTPPPLPGGVWASDGLFPEWVRVMWDSVGGASHYEVYRSSHPGGLRTLLDSPITPPYDDTSAEPGTTYYYWILACNNAGCSDWSEYDTGYRSHLPYGMQAGMTGPTVTHEWQRVDFPTAFALQPVLVAQITSESGSDNAHIDVAYVSASGFYVRVEEDLGLNGIHNQPEDVHWLAIPPGDYGTLKAGKTGEIVTHEWRRITFPTPFSQTPILVAQIATENGLDNSHIDIKDLSADGFSVRVEEDMREDGQHAAENVHWIATTAGQHDMILAGTTGRSVSHLWHPASFPSGSFSAPPVLVAQLVSEHGSDNCHLDLRICTESGFEARVEEDTEANGSHTEEVIHYIAVAW